jgi:hypothetical protein
MCPNTYEATRTLVLLTNAPRPPFGGIAPVVAPSVKFLKTLQLTARMHNLELTHYIYIKINMATSIAILILHREKAGSRYRHTW